MLLFKCLVVPFFILVASLVIRRWGAGIGGVVAGLPLSAGPILLVVALEYGRQFAATAALASLSGMLPFVAFGLTYCYTARRLPWPGTYLVAIAIWTSFAAIISLLPARLLPHLLIGASSLAVVNSLLPRRVVPTSSTLSGVRVELKMAMGAVLTLGVSWIARYFGDYWAGLFTVFPIMCSVLIVSAHRSGGPDLAHLLFRGMAQGAWSAFAMLACLSQLLLHFSIIFSFFVGLVAAIFAQMSILLVTLRSNCGGLQSEN